MQFQNAIITEQGVRIFQAALANNPVVFTKCLFSGSATPLTASMTALPEPTWGNGHVTNYAANDNGGDFIIYASATNATDYGYAYGYGIYGYLQNEGIENETLLVVANYDGNVTYVSEASGPYTRFHFAITIKLSMASEVISVAPHYNDLVSNAAFQTLANRTVTTHTAVDPNAGDDQRILGDKTFVGQTTFDKTQDAPALMLDNDENEFNERQPCARLRAYNGGEYGAAIELTMAAPSTPIVYTNGNVLPMTSGHQSLGNQNYKWGYMTVGAVNVDHLYVNSQNYQLDLFGSTIQLCDEQSEPYAVLDVETGHLVISDERGGAVTITPALNVTGGCGVGGSMTVDGALYARSALYATAGLQCTGNLIIDQVTMTGVGDYLGINKPIAVAGNVTSTELHLSGNMIGINSSGGEPYYMAVSGGVLRIGMNYNGGAPTGGGIRVSALTAESANLRFSSFGFTDGAQLDNGNYPFVYQTPETMSNPQIPMGCMFMAFVSCPSPILMGNRIPAAATINTVDLVPDNSGSVDMSLNALVIQRSNVPNGMGFVALSPVTFYDSSRQEYVNITLVMRVA